MSEGATAPTPKKAKGAKKQKSASNHPKYLEMAMSAIGQLGERNGSSRQAIHKYIMGKYNVGKDPKVVNTHLKMALKRGVTTGVLKHVKGQGASGSFRLTSEKKEVGKKPAAVKAKPKAAAVKAKKPKASKPAKKPPAPKKKKAAAPAKPKPKPAKKVKKAKPAKPKTPKPKAAKKPAKAASKPKKAKSTKKGKK